MLAVKTISRIILRFCLSVLRSSRVPWEEQRSDQREQEAGGDCPQEVFFDRRQIGTKLSCCCHTIILLFSPHKDKNNNVIKYCIYEAYLALTFQGRHPPQPLLCSTSPKCLVFHHQMSSRLLFFPKIVSFMKFDHQDSLSQTCLVFLSCIPFEPY